MQPASTKATVFAPTGCCPPFDPTPWQDQELHWHDKPFVRDHVTCLFHVPLNMGKRILADLALIEAAHAEPGHRLMLSDEKSPWGADIFIEVSKAVPGATMDRLSGTFLTKVFEGPFKEAGRWAREMKDHVAVRGRKLEKLYFGYTTCPRCAKAYGKNYVVLFAKVGDDAVAPGPSV
jgi:hydrolase family protein